MDDCIFCKIANGEIPAKILYENDHVAAFDDINPVAKVHTLIVTKKHFTNILEIDGTDEQDAAVLRSVQAAVREIARLKGVEKSGFRLISNCGQDGGQTVQHLHFHIIGGQTLGPRVI